MRSIDSIGTSQYMHWNVCITSKDRKLSHVQKGIKQSTSENNHFNFKRFSFQTFFSHSDSHFLIKLFFFKLHQSSVFSYFLHISTKHAFKFLHTLLVSHWAKLVFCFYKAFYLCLFSVCLPKFYAKIPNSVFYLTEKR